MFCDVRLAVAGSIDFFSASFSWASALCFHVGLLGACPLLAQLTTTTTCCFFCLQVWEKQASNTRQTRAKKRETQRNFPSASGGGGSFIAQNIRKKKKFCELNFFFLLILFFSVCLTVCERRLRSGAEKKTRKIYCEIYFPRIISLA